MLWEGAAITLMAAKTGFGPSAVGAIVIGVGTALVYPPRLAAVGGHVATDSHTGRARKPP
jgi:hypothetical protein